MLTVPRAIALRAGVLALVLAVGTAILRGCEAVVARWDLGPAVQVHPAIRALDAGRRDR